MISWVLLVHVLSAMAWVGGGLMLMIVGIRARFSSSPEAIGEFGQTLPYVGLRVLMPSVVLVLVTGIWMVLAGAGGSFSQLWVLLGLGLFAVAFVVGAVYLSRVGIQLERMAKGEAVATAEAVRVINRWLVGYGVVLAVLLAAVWDMVFKPGL